MIAGWRDRLDRRNPRCGARRPPARSRSGTHNDFRAPRSSRCLVNQTGSLLTAPTQLYTRIPPIREGFEPDYCIVAPFSESPEAEVCAKEAECRFPINAVPPLASNHGTLPARRPRIPRIWNGLRCPAGVPSLTDGLRIVLALLSGRFRWQRSAILHLWRSIACFPNACTGRAAAVTARTCSV
jgi:hypothetical protein